MSFIRVSEYAALLLFILYLQCHHTKGEANNGKKYRIDKIGKTWKYASQSCTLMGSERAPSYVVNVQESYPADMEDSPHWIGATAEITPWFKFSGCYVYEAVPEEEIKKLDTRSAFIGPVADCYLQCMSHFGVNDTHCFCTLDLEKGRLNGTCELITSISFENDVIGYTHDNFDKKYHLAMYMLFDDTPKIKDNLDECLVNTDTDFMTKPCDSIDSSMRKWSKAIIEGPSSDGGRIQWTSFVRRHLMRWTKAKTGQTITNCVSVKKVANKKDYEKVLKPCDNILPLICEVNKTPLLSILIPVMIGISFIGVAVYAAYINEENRPQTSQSQSASAAQIDINPENNDNQALQQRGDQQSTSNEQVSMSGSTIRSTENQRESGSNDGDQYELPCPDGIM